MPNLSDEMEYNFFPSTIWIPSHGRWLSVCRKSKTAIAQECNELYWINPGSNIAQNSSCTTTNLPSLKPSKKDEIRYAAHCWKSNDEHKRCSIDAFTPLGSAHGVMAIVVGNGHGDTSSNPGQDWLHFT